MQLLLSPWTWIGILSLLCAFLGHGWLGEHDARVAFKAAVEQIGKDQEKRTRDRIAHDKLNKEKTDAQILANAGRLRYLGKRLLDARARGGYLPAPTGSPGSAERACFDRAELERSLGQLDAGIQGLATEGDAARAVIDRLREWRKGWKVD